MTPVLRIRESEATREECSDVFEKIHVAIRSDPTVRTEPIKATAAEGDQPRDSEEPKGELIQFIGLALSSITDAASAANSLISTILGLLPKPTIVFEVSSGEEKFSFTVTDLNERSEKVVDRIIRILEERGGA